jgi:hypothetical protein
MWSHGTKVAYQTLLVRASDIYRTGPKNLEKSLSEAPYEQNSYVLRNKPTQQFYLEKALLMQENILNRNRYIAVPSNTTMPFGRLLSWLAGSYVDTELTAKRRWQIPEGVFCDLPILGDVELQFGYYSCQERILKHLSDEVDFIYRFHIWLKDGAFYNGEILESEPDIIFAQLVDYDCEERDLYFVHKRVKAASHTVPFNSLMLTSKLTCDALLPERLLDLPERLLDLDATTTATRSLLANANFPLGDVHADDLEVMTITEQFKVLCAHNLNQSSQRS